MEITMNVDWITATRKFTETERIPDASFRDVAPLVLNELAHLYAGTLFSIERVQQQRFYDFAFKCSITGTVVNIALKGNNKGIMVVMPATTLRVFPDKSELLQGFFGLGYKITRLDVCFDVFNSAYSTTDIADKYEAEVGERGHDKFAFISSRTGSTLYVGARNSPCMVRVYDKGQETKTGLDWIRFEVEFKQYLADQISVQSFNDLRASGLWLQKKLGIQDHPVLSAIDDFCRASTVPVVKRPIPQSDKAAWLLSQVLPAFENMFKDEPINARLVWENFLGKLNPLANSTESWGVDNPDKSKYDKS